MPFAVLLDASDRADPSLDGTCTSLALIQALVDCARSPAPLVLLSRGTQVAEPLSMGVPASGVAGGGAWGFGRTLRLEHAGMHNQRVIMTWWNAHETVDGNMRLFFSMTTSTHHLATMTRDTSGW